MDTAISMDTGARDLTGKLVVSLIQNTLQNSPAASTPAPASVTGKGARIDMQV